ncbi:flavin-containing monooxygenase [Enterovirga sp. CN4-39]|uniref:flavin-containing monooxygenase n=1 Tax=Enterovirga sp. CN4-39 TaxID=3400910 RepID=UPI003C101E42
MERIRCVDVVVVGAGFAGLYMLHRLRCLGLTVQAYEAGDDVGGVWYWNRYPGARCDVESMQYSYSFDEDLQQEWRWTERYASQPELLAYAGHVADRFDLRRDIKFATRVRSARFLETKALWEMVTAAGDVLHARFCIMATGCLSSARIPRLPGMERFRGRSFHTGGWPHEPVSFEGERVGVIGTGSSGIQAIPLIAREAANLFVFQRTPNFSVPAQNWPMPEEYERSWKRDYPALRRRAREASTSGSLTDPGQHKVHDIPPQEREQLFEARWKKGGVYFLHAFTDLLLDEASNKEAADFVRRKIRSIVKDAAVADLLTPTDHAIGAKRICVDTDYYDTFNRPNVTLVDLRSDPIEEVTVTGLRTTRKEYALDAIVYATGYDAMTGALLNMEIIGRGGLTLQDKWQDGPRSYLGMMVAGFPNLFTITGPGSPSVLSNMIFSIEQHVEWIGDCLGYLEQNRLSTIEAEAAAEEEWVEHVNAVADRTLYPKAASWYTGANVPGKPRVFMPYVGGVVAYRRKCDKVAAAGYSGFTLARAEVAETSMA